MKHIVHSEYRFSNTLKSGETIGLTVYINYEKKTYDIVQDHQEGIYFKTHNTECSVNRSYMFLAIEALDFIEEELERFNPIT